MEHEPILSRICNLSVTNKPLRSLTGLVLMVIVLSVEEFGLNGGSDESSSIGINFSSVVALV